MANADAAACLVMPAGEGCQPGHTGCGWPADPCLPARDQQHQQHGSYNSRPAGEAGRAAGAAMRRAAGELQGPQHYLGHN